MSTEKSLPPWEEGFTLAETLVAVLILALLSAGTGVGVRTFFKSAAAMERENRYLQEILLFEKVFRKQTERIFLPWFLPFDEGLIPYTGSPADGTELRIPFVDGRQELELILTADDSGLQFQYPGKDDAVQTLLLRELGPPEAELIILSERAAGVRLSLTGSDGRQDEELFITGLFGGLPIYRDDDE